MNRKFKWDKYFNKIYCLSLADYQNRRDDVVKELERIGIDTKADYFEWKITVRNYFYKYMWENPNFKIDSWWRNNNSALNATMGHYEILKEAQAMGYEKILIIEDDVRFLKDIETIWNTIKETPQCDICFYGGNPREDYRSRCVELKRNNKMFYDSSSIVLLGLEMISFSRKAINFLIGKQEEKYQPADWYVNSINGKQDDLIRLATVNQIAIQNAGYRYNETDYSYKIENIYKNILSLNDFNIM